MLLIGYKLYFFVIKILAFFIYFVYRYSLLESKLGLVSD